MRGVPLACLAIILGLAVPVGAMQRIDRAVAVVGDEAITHYDVREAWMRVGAPNGVGFQEMLQQKITDVMINQETQRLGIEVGEREIDRAVSDVLTSQNIDMNRLIQQLELAGTTLEAYRDTIADQIRQVKVVNQRIRANISVSEAELNEHYQRYRMELGLRMIADARIILLPFKGEKERDSVGRTAEEIHVKIQQGADFAQLAEKHTRGPGSDDGGMVRGIQAGTLQPALDRAIFGLEVGSPSPPIEGKGAWFLVLVESREEEDPQTLDEVRAQLTDLIYKQKFNDYFSIWVEEIRDATAIRIFENGDPPLGAP